MALDTGRAERIHALKQQHPELTWREIADKIGVSERSALDWQATGGISHSNCKKLAKVFGVDPDWLWSGSERREETPDLMGSLRSDAGQLDALATAIAALDAKMDLLLERVSGLDVADFTEQITQHFEVLGRTQKPASGSTALGTGKRSGAKPEAPPVRAPRKKRSA